MIGTVSNLFLVCLTLSSEVTLACRVVTGKSSRKAAIQSVLSAAKSLLATDEFDLSTLLGPVLTNDLATARLHLPFPTSIPHSPP